MYKLFAIAKKELESFFKSPIAYITLIITISVFNFFFFLIIDQNQEASLRDMFKLMEFMFIFIIPLLTMRIFSEEKHTGTIEFLMTCPVKNSSILLGKYLASLVFFSLILSLTNVYYFLMQYFAHPDRGEVAAGYLGVWLEGALFIAIGIMTSSWTKNQLIAAISSYAILLTFYFLPVFGKYLSPKAQELISYAGFLSHAGNFSAGLITTGDLVYYLSGIFFCIGITRLSIENRLWR